MGSLISMGNIWFVQALISLLFFVLYPRSVLFQLHAALILSKSASYCLSFLLFFLQALYLNMQDIVSCCGKDSLFCFSPLLSSP